MHFPSLCSAACRKAKLLRLELSWRQVTRLYTRHGPHFEESKHRNAASPLACMGRQEGTGNFAKNSGENRCQLGTFIADYQGYVRLEFDLAGDFFQFQVVRAGIQSRGRGKQEKGCSQKLGMRPSSRNKPAPQSLEGNWVQILEPHIAELRITEKGTGRCLYRKALVPTVSF